MTIKNKNSGIQQIARNSFSIIRFGWLSIYVCILLVVSLVCNITSGQLGSEDIAQTILLKINSEYDELSSSDIPAALNTELLALPSESIISHPVAYSFPSPGTITTNFAAEINSKSSQNPPLPVDASSKQLERQLMESRISSLPQDHDKKGAAELKQMIEQVRSVKLEPQKPAQQPVHIMPVENIIPATVDEHHSQLIPAQKAENSASNETLRLIENQLKDPNLISNPFELAEILFKCDRHAQAAICYKQALKVLPADDPNVATERAWILFQIGNCLKNEDPNTARESYAELIRTHSNSPWAETAKARYAIIELYQQENPGDLIQQLNRTNAK